MSIRDSIADSALKEMVSNLESTMTGISQSCVDFKNPYVGYYYSTSPYWIPENKLEKAYKMALLMEEMKLIDLGDSKAKFVELVERLEKIV